MLCPANMLGVMLPICPHLRAVIPSEVRRFLLFVFADSANTPACAVEARLLRPGCTSGESLFDLNPGNAEPTSHSNCFCIAANKFNASSGVNLSKSAPRNASSTD